MKPKHQTVVGLSPKTKQLANVSWETRLRWMVEDYLREQALLKNRAPGTVGGQRPFDSEQSVSLTLIGNNLNTGFRLDGKPVLKPPSSGKPVSNDLRSQIRLAERGKGGVMTDHSLAIPGRRVISTTSTSGGVSTVSTVVQSVTAFQKILQFVFSTRGDHIRPNRHSYETRRINYGSGVTFAGDVRNNTVISGTQAVGFGLSAAWTDRSTLVYNKMLSKMYDNMRGEVDLSVDAFQARQSGMMLNQRFSQGRKLFTKAAPEALLAIGGIASTLRRSNIRDWGSLWLEWVYGWKPLAADIYGSMENMILASSPGSGVRGHPVHEQAQEIGDRFVTSTYDGNNVQHTKQVFSLYQARIVAFYALTTGGLNSVAGYTSLNPVSIAWELVPYSFVVDWFVDVGGYLRNLESSLLYNSDFVSGYVTQRSQKTILETAGGGDAAFSASASGNAETRGFNRAVLSSSPMPRAPSFNPKLGTSRLLSAASLLSQQLHSLKHVKQRTERSSRGENNANWDLFHHS